MAIIGIDLGTTNSLVTVYENGKVVPIPNTFGELLTPSVVSFDENGEVYVGKIAKEMLVTRPSATFAEFKRDMGSETVYRVGKKNYRPEELSAFVLRRLKEDAERHLGEPVTEAVISVPAYFNDDKRCATKNAGMLAGLVVERLINEPSAVALKHHMESDEMENFIIFDFGGGTLDVSLVEAFDNMVEIRAVAGDNYLGGKDFNEVIAREFYRENGLTYGLFNDKEHGLILKAAEQLKWELTKKNQAECTVHLQGKDYPMRMENQRLIHCSVDLFKRMSEPIRKVLNDSGMSWDEIDRVILAGGSSKMPIVQQYIKSICGAPVITDDDPDTCIALGVGMAAAIKERTGDIRDMILADICPFSLGVEIRGNIFSPIIERNDTLPCSRTRVYCTASDYQTAMEFPIYQGENMVADKNLLLGTMELLDLPSAPRGVVSAKVTFMYDINGILDIQIESGKQSAHKLIFNKKIGLSEAALKARIEELKQQTLHPAEQEENRLLIERAERMYIECSGYTRKQIVAFLQGFREALDSGREQRIREAYVQLSVALAAIEQGQTVIEEFDESFWKEDGEVDD